MKTLALLVLLLGWLPLVLPAAEKPNFIFILCDDLGYGDVKCYNPSGKIPTPNVDRLAAEGMRFTDAHTTSSVCTPTRYSLLTGRYNWRSRLQRGVLGGLSPSLIEPGRLTLPALLKQQGYHTAAIGKWHLGLDWVKIAGQPAPPADNIETSNQVNSVDYTQPFQRGPTHLGFDYYFGIAASLDMVPYTFLENDRVAVVPAGVKKFPMMHGKSGGFTRPGPAAPEFTAANVLPEFTRKTIEYLTQRAEAAKAGHPFFLYLALASPHTPIAPTPEWQGKSGVNPYADFTMQTDAAVGQILAALEKHGLAQNTLVVFTSDNGCSPAADIAALNAAGHRPNGDWRGHKADLWEGGHRVPFIVRWPGQVKAGTTCDALVSLVDFMATCADALSAKLPPNAAEDSVSFLPALRGQKPARAALVHHSINGNFAIRQGPWKLCFAPGSGGWSAPRDEAARKQKMPERQLYNLASDPAESSNLQAAQPEVVTRLTQLLEKYVADGRSTPGPNQTNTVSVQITRRNN